MLKNADQNDCGNLADNNGHTANNEEVVCLNTPCTPVCDTNAFENQYKWLQSLGTGLVVEPHHLCNAETCAEFVCVHNRDSSDFMNKDKFLWYILKKTKRRSHMNGTYWMRQEKILLNMLQRMRIEGLVKSGANMAGIGIRRWKISLKQVREKLYGCPPRFPFKFISRYQD